MQDKTNYLAQISEASAYIQQKLGGRRPIMAIILGSGLGDLAEMLEDTLFIPYEEIPNFPVSTVPGHVGRFAVGTLGGHEVICMQGRFHYYEGYDMQQVTLPIRVMKTIGVQSLIVTNAAGGINSSFKPGNLMLIKDHINLTGQNPLIGENLDEFGLRFIDMTCAYDKEYRKLAQDASEEMGLHLKKGVYTWLTGPNFETPAEIKFLHAIGADAVGMSTVPEVIVARHCGIRVLGISCITNMAAGMSDGLLSHTEVNETADKVKDVFCRYITRLVAKMA